MEDEKSKKLIHYSIEQLNSIKIEMLDSFKNLPTGLTIEYLKELKIYNNPNAPRPPLKNYSRTEIKEISNSMSHATPGNMNIEHIRELGIARGDPRQKVTEKDTVFMPDWKENGNGFRRREGTWKWSGYEDNRHHRSSYHEMGGNDGGYYYEDKPFSRFRSSSDQHFDDNEGLQMPSFRRAEHPWRGRRRGMGRRVEKTPEWILGDPGEPGVVSSEYFDRAIPDEEPNDTGNDVGKETVEDLKAVARPLPKSNGATAARKEENRKSSSSWDDEFYADINQLLSGRKSTESNAIEKSRFHKFFANDSGAVAAADEGANDLKGDDGTGGKIITVSELEKGISKKPDNDTAAFQNFLRMMDKEDEKAPTPPSVSVSSSFPTMPPNQVMQYALHPQGGVHQPPVNLSLTQPPLLGKQHTSAPNLIGQQQQHVMHRQQFITPQQQANILRNRPDTLAFLPTSVKRNLIGESQGDNLPKESTQNHVAMPTVTMATTSADESAQMNAQQIAALNQMYMARIPVITPPSFTTPTFNSGPLPPPPPRGVLPNALSSPQLGAGARRPILPSPVQANMLSNALQTQLLTSQAQQRAITGSNPHVQDPAMIQQQMKVMMLQQQQQQLAMAKAKQLALHQMKEKQNQERLAGLFAAPIGRLPASGSSALTLDEVEGKPG